MPLVVWRPGDTLPGQSFSRGSTAYYLAAESGLPKIVWGDAFEHTLRVGFLDNVRAWGEPREGSTRVTIAAGETDGWEIGYDYYVEGDVRWIPAQDQTDPIEATGWNSPAGWDAFLRWARPGRPFRWHPEGEFPAFYDVVLEAPLSGAPEIEDDGTRTIRGLRLRSVAGTPFTEY